MYEKYPQKDRSGLESMCKIDPCYFAPVLFYRILNIVKRTEEVHRNSRNVRRNFGETSH